MSHWNYRLCVEQVSSYVGPVPFYSIREVYYDDDGAVRGWTETPATFSGDTPGEVVEALFLAAKSYPAKRVLDLDKREEVDVSYHGKRRTES